ncbi:hypothetical protein [Streptomyces coeruleorubidus]|uniref:Uncharacterized protein n=1 Tax=Streptomyces coeruleorubidus TaxID=116188 RepID=A0A5J6HZJ9_STRC4|nr:hypothetical protein [Streptomyces coeruleorubidus]QEV23871.1 hypothetical protein CP976_06755 [Streptomyces coeruleorubidus]GGT86492.1 hypothetical protein GCM10010256_53430 [Streptomyces coeruleorubidus]
MTPQQKVTALALAALRNDPVGLAVLLGDLDDDEVRSAAGIALLNLCNGFRAILTDDAMREVIAGMQALAASEAGGEGS